MTQLTKHFALSEFLFSETASRLGIDNTPTDTYRKNLDKLAAVMETIRVRLGHPVIITSGYRSSELNQAVGGVWNSAHLFGLACDFVCPGYGTPIVVGRKVSEWVKELEIDQLIREHFGQADWIHLGLSNTVPRNMIFSMNAYGIQDGIQ